jgi:hypothetical protein
MTTPGTKTPEQPSKGTFQIMMELSTATKLQFTGAAIYVISQVIFMMALCSNVGNKEDITIPIVDLKLTSREQFTWFRISFIIDLFLFIVFTYGEYCMQSSVDKGKEIKLYGLTWWLSTYFAPYTYSREKLKAVTLNETAEGAAPTGLKNVVVQIMKQNAAAKVSKTRTDTFIEYTSIGLCAVWRALYELASTFMLVIYTLVMTFHEENAQAEGMVLYFIFYLGYHVMSRAAVRSFSVDVKSASIATDKPGNDKRHTYTATVVFDGAIQHFVKLLLFVLFTWALHSPNELAIADPSDATMWLRIIVVIFWLSMAFHESLNVMNMTFSLLNQLLLYPFTLAGCKGTVEKYGGSEEPDFSFTGEQLPLMKRAVNVSPGFVI